MAKTVLSDGDSRLIALICSSEKDLGNISSCFYKEFHESPDACPYTAAYRAPRLQMLMVAGNAPPAPRPCRMQGINGGRPLPFEPDDNTYCRDKYDPSCSSGGGGISGPRRVYYYDLAIIGECGNVDFCLDAFFKRMGLREVEGCSTYMLDTELRSIMGQWQENAVNSCDTVHR